jgi:IclR family KDG regulon transcriptional repressor
MYFLQRITKIMPRPSKLIGSVERAFGILDLFDSRSPELGMTEIARAMGLHKSTVASLIYTLEAQGYLAQNPVTRKYRLGLKLVERASVVLSHVELRQVALPHLQVLRDEFDEGVNLAILDGAYVVYVERMVGTRALGVRTEVGKREPAHSTALGKAILSSLPNAQVEAFVKQHGLPRVTSQTITSLDRLCRELDETRQRGFAIDNEESELGERCVAAPIFDHAGEVAAAVSVSAPVSRLPMSEMPRFSAQVRKTAETISRSLGYSPPA